MPSWIADIADTFDADLSPLYLVHDGDNLLANPRLRAAVEERGFQFHPYDDPVAFRYLFERDIRPCIHAHPPRPTVVPVDSASSADISFDILREGRFVRISLKDLMPKMDIAVLRQVPPEDLDDVIAAYHDYAGTTLGEQKTREWILREVYGIVPASLTHIDRLVQHLLQRHLAGNELHESFDRWLAERLAPKTPFDDVYALLQSSGDFFSWLQHQWERYVEDRVWQGETEGYLPFHVPAIRSFLPELFLQGRLHRVPATGEGFPGWMRIGIALPEDTPGMVFRSTLTNLGYAWPLGDVSHRDWLAFAWQWGALRSQISTVGDDIAHVLADEMHPVQGRMEEAFSDWMYQRFQGLWSLAVTDIPILVHQVPQILRRASESGERIALVVVDGMALDHWLTIRDASAEWMTQWEIAEHTCFAWVPTLTSISRQSIFAGRRPQLFPETWKTTSGERKHWQRTGADWGLPKAAIAYVSPKVLGSARIDDPLSNILQASDDAVCLLGLVISDIDNLAHASTLGVVEMQRDVRLWAASGNFARLIAALLSKEFTVYLVADHGSVEATGRGQPSEGLLVEMRALRARIYDAGVFAEATMQQYPHAKAWPPIGLPDDLSVLIADDLTAFDSVGSQVVAHGGIALEEVVVPFIRIRRRA